MKTTDNSDSVLGEYMPKDELAKNLDRCSRTLDRWASLGIGPPRTILGRRVLYRRQAVTAWLLAQEEAPSNDRAA